MKILVIGDSFAADWNLIDQPYLGWPNLLSEKYDVLNLAQAGVSQYKIYKQLISIDFSKFDYIILCFTDDYRIHIKEHPIHNKTILHKDCDLILADFYYHSSKFKNFFNLKLLVMNLWLRYFCDLDYYKDISSIIKIHIQYLLKDMNVITNSDLGIPDLFKTNRGVVNHLDEKSNILVFNRIVNKLN